MPSLKFSEFRRRISAKTQIFNPRLRTVREWWENDGLFAWFVVVLHPNNIEGHIRMGTDVCYMEHS